MKKLIDLIKEFKEVDSGPKRWFKPYGDKYTEWEKHTNHTNKEPMKEIQKIHEVRPFVDKKLQQKHDGSRDGLVYLATNDDRYPTEIVLYNTKRDVLHFLHSQGGNWNRATQETVPIKGFNSTHWIQPYLQPVRAAHTNESKKVKLKDLVNELKIGNKINKARAKAHFKQGEKIAVVHKATKNAMPIEDIKQIDTFDTKEYDFAYITESVNEALPRFKSPFEAYDWIMNKRGEAMDIEMEMMETSKEIQMAYGEMEQDAEPGGGPIADRYGKEIEALENKHKDLRAQFDMVMAEIDEYDQN